MISADSSSPGRSFSASGLEYCSRYLLGFALGVPIYVARRLHLTRLTLIHPTLEREFNSNISTDLEQGG